MNFISHCIIEQGVNVRYTFKYKFDWPVNQNYKHAEQEITQNVSLDLKRYWSGFGPFPLCGID